MISTLAWIMTLYSFNLYFIYINFKILCFFFGSQSFYHLNIWIKTGVISGSARSENWTLYNTEHMVLWDSAWVLRVWPFIFFWLGCMNLTKSLKSTDFFSKSPIQKLLSYMHKIQYEVHLLRLWVWRLIGTKL